MNSAVAIAPFSEVLPGTYNCPEILGAISFDGQVYVDVGDGAQARVESWEVYRLAQIGRLLRIDPTYWDRKANRGKNVGWKSRIVRNLITEHRLCRDCGQSEDALFFVWVERRCSYCWSLNTDVQKSVATQRPNTFRNKGSAPLSPHAGLVEKYPPVKHIWGIAPNDDARMLRVLSNVYSTAPEAPGHLYLIMRFAETLKCLPQYSLHLDRFNLLINIGNICQRYFKVTSSPEGACAMLASFEEASRLDDDPIPVAMAKHSFGMAAVYLLDAYSEPDAELAVNRPNIRRQAISYVRESLALLHTVQDRQNTDKGIARTIWALADLLARGKSTPVELEEAMQLFAALKERELEPHVAYYLPAIQAESRLAEVLPADHSDDQWARHVDAAMILISMIEASNPNKRLHRWHWALSVGVALSQTEAIEHAQYFLEAAVTFALKDTTFYSDPLTVLRGAERFYDAFNALAHYSYARGQYLQSLSLLETFRGRVMELYSQPSEERAEILQEESAHQDDAFFGMFGPQDSPTLIAVDEKMWELEHNKRYGSFLKEYELSGLVSRLGELLLLVNDKTPGILVSLAIDERTFPGSFLVYAMVIFQAPDGSVGLIPKHWVITGDQMQALTNQVYQRPSSFREERLTNLSRCVYDCAIQHLNATFVELKAERALIAMPSRLSNLPLESFRGFEETRARACDKFAFIPSFMFGRDRPSVLRDRLSEKVLIVGYVGSDLTNADEEAQAICSLFQGRATYLRGQNCTKRTVIEQLNGDYDFVHFICHGTYESAHPGESSLYFNEQRHVDSFRLRSREIREFVRFRNRPVITLSACSTALIADSRSNTWRGLPGSLLESRARCIIGTRWPIADRVSRELMSYFYGLLAETDQSPMDCFHEMQAYARGSQRMEEWACFGYLGLP
jgi:tetratricopeptide (TPR) repeat protein